VQSRLLLNHYLRKYKQEDQRHFRLFIFAQFIHYGALLLLLLGGLFFIVVALRALF
jgi:hypothetical protein